MNAGSAPLQWLQTITAPWSGAMGRLPLILARHSTRAVQKFHVKSSAWAGVKAKRRNVITAHTIKASPATESTQIARTSVAAVGSMRRLFPFPDLPILM